MDSRAILAGVIALHLAGCSAITRFSGAVKHAKQTGREVVVYEINPRTSPSRYYGPVGVYFINTTSKPIRSITFDLLSYRNHHAVRRAIKSFTATGPFAPNHSYRYLTPQPAWPKLKGANNCVTLVGMKIKHADGRVTRIKEHDVNSYLTSNVATACGQHRPG